MESYNEKQPIEYLFQGLKGCNPISDKLLMELLKRVGVSSN
jgi:hypothetical protein